MIMTTVDKDKPICHICGKPFATKGSLKTHMINIHGDKTKIDFQNVQPESKDKLKQQQLKMDKKKSEIIEELPVELASIQKDIFTCLEKVKAFTM